MARRSDIKRLRVAPENLVRDYERAERMVKQFDRKGLHKTSWHDDLFRLGQALKQYEVEKGEIQDG